MIASADHCGQQQLQPHGHLDLRTQQLHGDQMSDWPTIEEEALEQAMIELSDAVDARGLSICLVPWLGLTGKGENETRAEAFRRQTRWMAESIAPNVQVLNPGADPLLVEANVYHNLALLAKATAAQLTYDHAMQNRTIFDRMRQQKAEDQVGNKDLDEGC